MPDRAARPTREQVVGVALEVADTQGLDALSMRALAERVGLPTMTLYGYFRSKDELLDAIVDHAVGDEPFAIGDGDWQEQLKLVVRLARRGLLAHPSIVELRVRRPVLRPEALRFGETLLRILRDAGFDVRDSALAFRLLFTFTLGFAALSPAGNTEADRAAARSALASLSPEDYPALSEARDEASLAMGGEDAFAFGLDRIVDGLAARLAAQA